MDNISAIWDKALSQIRAEVTQITYNTLITDLRPAFEQEGVLYIEVPTEANKNILENRYSGFINSAVQRVAVRDLRVEFITMKQLKKLTEKKSKESGRELQHYSLNEKYTFDSFVVGNSNRFAHAASLSVAREPGRHYNPLFIYGGTGLGKTHLMHAVGHYIQQKKPSSRIMYVSSEQFTNELINCMRMNSSVESFRIRYRSVDVLMVDDIQFIIGKERTQEEFFHTFNTLYQANKQIILTSDKSPNEMQNLEVRLRSRFDGGLLADIQAPDLETRVAILWKKSQSDNLTIGDDVLLYIAGCIESNVRELEGALTRVIAYATLQGTSLSQDLAEEALRDYTRSNAAKAITAQSIKQKVADYYSINEVDFSSEKRSRQIAYPRQIAMYLTRELTDLTLPNIGKVFGDRYHSTVMHACKRIEEDIKRDPKLKAAIQDITTQLKK